MKRSEILKKLERDLAALGHPIKVTLQKLTQHISTDVDELSPEELCEIIMNKDYTFTSGYRDCVYIEYREVETDEARSMRIQNEQARLDAYNAEVKKLNQAIDAERKRIALAKQAARAKYDDPDYVEYLRLTARLKEKGYFHDE